MEPVEIMYPNNPTNHKAALNAYQRAQSSVMTSLQIEVMAFRRAASKMKQAATNMTDFIGYVEALQFNQRLWTAIQAGLTDQDCQVPEPVRTKMLNLSLYVDTHTLDAIIQPSASHLSSLINIDLNLADGLFEGRQTVSALN
jgi:flagellar biosynthesis regulator FlaF